MIDIKFLEQLCGLVQLTTNDMNILPATVFLMRGNQIGEVLSGAIDLTIPIYFEIAKILETKDSACKFLEYLYQEYIKSMKITIQMLNENILKAEKAIEINNLRKPK